MDYNGGHHWDNVMLLLTLLDSIDGIPSYKAVGVQKFFACIHYDGMPINIGTFPRQKNGKTFFDGISPKIALDKMKELYRDGNVAVHKYITENCSWLSEVREYDMVDASGTVCVNVYTKFSPSGGDAECVKEELREALGPLEACTNCIISNKTSTCIFDSLKEPCRRCGEHENLQESPCVSAKIIHVSSDQTPSQRKAHSEMNANSSQYLNESSYTQFGFGLLHFEKNCISSLRHYRLTDMSGTFYVGLLTAVWASNADEAKIMKKAALATVFSFRDAHSDEIGYKTVCKQLEDIVKETKGIVATLVPEQYKPTATEAKSHTILGRPLYVACNNNGEFLWTGKVFT